MPFMAGEFSQPIIRHLMQRWFRLTRCMTLGVRALVIDGQGKFSSYGMAIAGVAAAGGGVERGETALQALARELREEAAITLTQEPELFGFYSNEKISAAIM